MSAFFDLASVVLVPSGYKSGKIYAQKPLTTDGQLTFTRASTATRVNASGLIETVSSGVPRLDYQGSTCPRLLLEPQRTNLLTYSEQFDNAAWSSNGTVVANQGVSPSGYTDADLFYSTTGAGKRIFNAVTITSGSAYTSSVFAKASGKSFIYFPDVDNIANTVWFNLSNGTFSTPTQGTATIVDYGNGWYRCSLTTTSTSTTGYSYVAISDASGSTSFTQNGTDGVLLWGSQLELGAYPTSYIPTLSTSVTRVADVASKTGISSLIGQTEGAVFFEIDQLANVSKLEGILYLSDGTSTTDYINFYFGFTNVLYCDVSVGGVIQASFNLGTITTLTKIALAYKANDFAVYKNGVQIGTDNSGSVPTTNKLSLGATQVGSAVMKGVFVQALLFKTRLTNAQLAELTTL